MRTRFEGDELPIKDLRRAHDSGLIDNEKFIKLGKAILSGDITNLQRLTEEIEKLK